MTDKVLIIIRGLPGSGKSFLAHHIHDAILCNGGMNGWEVEHWQADDFFGIGKEYKFTPEDVPKAHKWCFNGVVNSMLRKVENIIVSNTATRRWEYENYIKAAREYGYKVQVIDVHGEFENVHGVPEEHLTKMAERWEPFDRELLSSRYGE